MQTNYEYMKGFNRVKAFLLRVWHSLFFKYAVVAIAGVVIVGFLDDNSFWSHFKNMQRINELQEETEKYNADLDRNPKAIEKIARERYFMKADDEDIFVLSDDGEDENPIKKHETTE